MDCVAKLVYGSKHTRGLVWRQPHLATLWLRHCAYMHTVYIHTYVCIHTNSSRPQFGCIVECTPIEV